MGVRHKISRSRKCNDRKLSIPVIHLGLGLSINNLVYTQKKIPYSQVPSQFRGGVCTEYLKSMKTVH